jgi:hypothetical protein
VLLCLYPHVNGKCKGAVLADVDHTNKMLDLQDKNALSFAAIMGIQTDLGLSASEYSWVGSIV